MFFKHDKKIYHKFFFFSLHSFLGTIILLHSFLRYICLSFLFPFLGGIWLFLFFAASTASAGAELLYNTIAGCRDSNPRFCDLFPLLLLNYLHPLTYVFSPFPLLYLPPSFSLKTVTVQGQPPPPDLISWLNMEWKIQFGMNKNHPWEEFQISFHIW